MRCEDRRDPFLVGIPAEARDLLGEQVEGADGPLAVVEGVAQRAADARALHCPWPVLRPAGIVLEVVGEHDLVLPDRVDAGGLHLADEFVGHIEQTAGGERGRLLHEVDRAGIERRKHLLLRVAGDADENDRNRRRAICCRTKVAPSICGMLRSQVTTSGFSSRRVRALPARHARSHHFDEGTLESICLTTLRTYAESSTTSTRRRCSS